MRVSRNVVVWLFASLLVVGVVSAAVANSVGQATPSASSPDDDGTPDQGPGCCEPGDDRGGDDHRGRDSRHGDDRPSLKIEILAPVQRALSGSRAGERASRSRYPHPHRRTAPSAFDPSPDFRFA